MFQLYRNILFVLVFTFFSAADANDFYSLEGEPAESKEPDFGSFQVSTELDMGKAALILQDAPGDLYVSVGADRSFRGAAMANASGLLVVDMSPNVLRFGLINRELLRAKTLSDYQWLRYAADYAGWQRFQAMHPGRRTLSEGDFKWWHVQVLTQPHEVGNLHGWRPQVSEKDPSRGIDFWSGNYIFDVLLYERLHKLALADRIFVVFADLRDPVRMKDVAHALAQSGEKIGVLDLSNAYLVAYMWPSELRFAVETFMPFAQNTSKLLGMSINLSHVPDVFNRHTYFSYTFKALRDLGTSLPYQVFARGAYEMVGLIEGIQLAAIGFVAAIWMLGFT